MKYLVSITMMVIPLVLVGQDFPRSKNGEGFNSVFLNLSTGQFQGTINGVLIIENLNSEERILDFQGSQAELIIEPDPDEVYDVSTKIYKGETTSGKTSIEYKTYGLANSIGLRIFNNWFELSFIDGGCDLVIAGIDYMYKSEDLAEYLILRVTEKLILNNWNQVNKTEHTRKSNNNEELKSKKEITILPNSTLVFAIKRNE
uniref:Uncharacterized protein n=1 Tax=Roseihalotalea indica TaxID=2867963 RepID=A0AA49JC76_9BACT|nr:hypothetical protein K4G66_18835 [Tunicatimonas sp. TK19036]